MKVLFFVLTLIYCMSLFAQESLPSTNDQNFEPVSVITNIDYDYSLRFSQSEEGYLLLERCSLDNSCSTVGEAVSSDSLSSALLKISNEQAKPTVGMYLGLQGFWVATIGCVLIKRCLTKLRSVPSDTRTMILAAGSPVAGGLGALVGSLLNDPDLDHLRTDPVSRATRNERQQDQSEDGIREISTRVPLDQILSEYSYVILLAQSL